MKSLGLWSFMTTTAIHLTYKKQPNELIVNQGRILGAGMNKITDAILDHRGYMGIHARKKAVKKLEEWNRSGYLRDSYRVLHKKGREITYIPETDHRLE